MTCSGVTLVGRGTSATVHINKYSTLVSENIEH